MASLQGLTDAQARNLVLQALRSVRKAYRQADSSGERFERELGRLLSRKTRINASSLAKLADQYASYNGNVDAVQQRLTDALNAARQI